MKSDQHALDTPVVGALDVVGQPVGVALHEGVVPGYKASHGCIRLSNAAIGWLAGRLPAGAPLNEVLESAEGLRYIAKVGDTRPFHATAIGKALLSTMSAFCGPSVRTALRTSGFSVTRLFSVAALRFFV